MAEEKNNNLTSTDDAIMLLNNRQIVGKLRTVHSGHLGPGTCTGFSYERNLIQMGRDIPFSYYHFDIDALFTIPMRHFIVGCINYSTGTQTNDIQFMVTGKTEGKEDEEHARVREINEEISINCLELDGVTKINVNMGNHVRYNEGNPIRPRPDTNYMHSVVVNQKVQEKADKKAQEKADKKAKDAVAVGSYIHIDTAANAVNFLQNLGNTQGHTDAGIIGICVVNVETMINQIQEQIKAEYSQVFINKLGNSPMRIKSKSSSCRDCKLYLSQFLVKDLKKIAKQFDCKNSSNMTKSELIKYILAHHKK